MSSLKEKKRLSLAKDEETLTSLKLFAKYYCRDFGPKALERILDEAGVKMDAKSICRTANGTIITDRSFRLKDGLEAVAKYRKEIQKAGK